MRRLKRAPRLTSKKIVSLIASFLLYVLYTYWGQSGDVLQGRVTRVVDGDTLHVLVSGEDRNVRLIGVDTPETVHPSKPVQYYGKEASDFAKKSLLGKNVWLEYDTAPLDRYNRHLVYLWLEEPKEGEATARRGMFNSWVLLQGYGKIVTVQPNSRHSDMFLRFQREAQSEGRGLWGKR